VCREGELSLDARAAEGGKGVCDALRHNRVRVMPVTFFRPCIITVDVVKPGACRITFETMKRSTMYHLDGTKLVHWHWQQHTCFGATVAVVPRLRLHEVSVLDDHDRTDQYHQ
jgi:hypothetical protein